MNSFCLDLMTGRVLTEQERYVDAIKRLRAAVTQANDFERMMTAQQRFRQALSWCGRASDAQDHAYQALEYANYYACAGILQVATKGGPEVTEDIMRKEPRMLDETDLAAVSSIKDAGNAYVAEILKLVPAGRERSLAITNAEQAVMWAVKGITA